MSLEEFWQSTPRVLDIAMRAYSRRRGWAAYHAGAPGNFKDVDIEQLMGLRRPDAPRKVDPEEIKLKMHRWAVMHNARLAAIKKD